MPSLRSSGMVLGSSLMWGVVAVVAAQEVGVPFPVTQVVAGDFHRYDAVVDLDLDGDPDYIGSWDDGDNINRVHWHRNRGDGIPDQVELVTEWVTPGFWPNSVKFLVDDFDGDGRDDVVVLGISDVFPILSRHGGPLVGPSSPTAEQSFSLASCGDVNGDGVPEVVARRPSARIRVYQFDTATFAFTEIADFFTPQRGLTLANIDTDPQLEVLVTTSTWVFRYDVVGNQFVGAGPIPNHIGEDPLVVVGDVDGDLDDDVVLFKNSTVFPTHSVLRFDGSALVPEPPIVGGPATHFADIDGDGDVDGLCCGGGIPWDGINDAPAEFRISLNDGTGFFAASYPIDGMGARHLAGATDVDNDGDRDLVAGRCVIFNRTGVPVAYENGIYNAKREVRLTDLDGDFDLDYGLSASTTSTGYWANQGDGVFTSVSLAAAVPVGETRTRLTEGDFDGDGDVDILVEDTTGGVFEVRLIPNEGGSFPVSVLAAVPGMRFSQTSNYTDSNAAAYENQWAVVGDWDGDGDLDVVMVDEGDGWSALWRNDGLGFFTAGPTLPADVVVVGIADFDGDGQPDLLVGTADDLGELGIMHGGPGGAAFGPEQTLGVIRDQRPGIVDIDADGDVDLLVGWPGSGILRNDGSGSFSFEPLSLSRGGHLRWDFGDFDNNGRIDAIFQPRYRGTTSVLMQDENGGFAEAMMIGRASMVGDVDGDGDLDVAGTPNLVNVLEPASVRSFGAGCPGSAGVPALTATSAPWLGETYTLEVHNLPAFSGSSIEFGFSDQTWYGLTLPFDLSIIGMTDCIQYVDSAVVVLVGADALGVASYSLNLPLDSGLVGVRLFSQAFTIDPPANPLGGTLSNGVQARLAAPTGS